MLPPRDKHDCPSRPGPLLRLVCALLVLTVCAAPLLLRSFDVPLPVVYGATKITTDELYASAGDTLVITQELVREKFGADVATVRMINCYAGTELLGRSTITINQGVVIAMKKKESGIDDSQIDLDSKTTLNLHGKITGKFKKLSLPTLATFNVYLCDGAVFDATYDRENSVIAGDFTYYGYNAGTNGHGTVSVTDTDNVSVTNESVGSSNTTYIFTATPDTGYNRVVWTKNNTNGVFTDDNVLGRGNEVRITCAENAQYQVYANFIHDHSSSPVWTWDGDDKASVNFFCNDPNCPDGEGYTDTVDATVTPVVTAPTCTEDGFTTYTASYTSVDDGQTYTDTHVVTNSGTALGHDWGDWFDVTEQPTTTKTGIGSHTCQRCGITETGVIPALGTGEGGTGDNSKDYSFITGSVWSWKNGSTDGMPVILKNTVGDDSTTFDKLVSVSVDGTLLTQNVHYKATRGSINITLQPSYLKTLSTGQHTLTVKLTDATLEHTFTISASGGSDSEKGDSPKTGEGDGMLVFYTWLVIFSFGTIGSLIALKKKMKHAYR